jgi:protein-ribulosamine 3-kinase
MEWLDRPPADVYLRRVGAQLGQQLAALHRCERFWGEPLPGYRRDDGSRDGGGWQADGWDPDWPAFVRERLLRPRVERAAVAGRLSTDQVRRMELLMERVEGLFQGYAARPSLLHGDLHRGNVLCDARGAPALVDPSPSFGDHELELAKLEGIGWDRFPPVFYSAYHEALPAAPGLTERRDVYLIALYLADLNRGEVRRVGMIDAMAHRYVGA